VYSSLVGPLLLINRQESLQHSSLEKLKQTQPEMEPLLHPLQNQEIVFHSVQVLLPQEVMYLNLEVLHPQILQSLPKVLLLLGVLLNLNLLLEVLRNPNPLLVASQRLKVLLLALEVQVQVLLQTQNLPSRLSLLIYSRLEEVIVELRVRIPNRVHNPVFSNSAEHQVQTLPPLQLLDLLHQQVELRQLLVNLHHPHLTELQIPHKGLKVASILALPQPRPQVLLLVPPHNLQLVALLLQYLVVDSILVVLSKPLLLLVPCSSLKHLNKMLEICLA